jgi:hypothetical protein
MLTLPTLLWGQSAESADSADGAMGSVWSQAQAQLQEAVKGKPGRPAKAEENATQRVALKDPTLNGVGRQPTDRKSRLIRTLTNLKEDPEARNQSAESADSADCSRQQFQPVRVALIPPRGIGDDPGLTPRIHAVSDVVSPRPERIARSAACSRARKPAGSADSADGADGAMGAVGRVGRVG